MTCSVTTREACAGADGRWRGPNSTCETPCPSADLCDWNDDGSVNADDVMEFVADFRDGSADVNNDGQTNAQDMAAFFECFRINRGN